MTDDAAVQKTYDPAVYWPAPTRNFRTSARLHLQHQLCQNTLGFLLEPHVDSSVTTSQTLRVADLACGNGVWLLDLERHLSERGISCRLQGFDINPVNFPSSSFIPSNVTFQQLDILASPLPEELLGAFDVVHVRAFMSIIIDQDTAPLLSAARSLLKPGGWLQWEEMRGEFLIEPSSPSVSAASCAILAKILKEGGEAQGLKFGFVHELNSHLGRHGFEDVHMHKFPKRRQDFKGWTEDFLMVWEELASHLPSKADVPNAPVTRELWTDLFNKAVVETEQGVAVHQGFIMTVVGRKSVT
ncbi:hypothetical protein G7054_g12624 [Neopestalotiopsis clavispora]|nr:hypothetical protein G7054_g12624 [Neopestalotiopsis clavispora]